MAPISADDVLHFLEENPGFFLEHQEMIRPSGILDSDDPPESVLNIRHQLFERLNEERREMMSVLDETIELVRENEKIEGDFLAIERLVFHPSPSGAGLARIAEEIERRFALDHASFLMCEAADGAAPPARDPETAGRVRLGGNENARPSAGEAIALAGNLEEGASPLFPESCRADLRSTAVVTLTESDQILGLLLLGSKDPGRYAGGMATHLLERLAMRLGIGIRLLQRIATPGSARAALLPRKERTPPARSAEKKARASQPDAP